MSTCPSFSHGLEGALAREVSRIVSFVAKTLRLLILFLQLFVSFCHSENKYQAPSQARRARHDEAEAPRPRYFGLECAKLSPRPSRAGTKGGDLSRHWGPLKLQELRSPKKVDSCPDAGSPMQVQWRGDKDFRSLRPRLTWESVGGGGGGTGACRTRRHMDLRLSESRDRKSPPLVPGEARGDSKKLVCLDSG